MKVHVKTKNDTVFRGSYNAGTAFYTTSEVFCTIVATHESTVLHEGVAIRQT